MDSKKEHKAIAINPWVTARETVGSQVLLFTPSDQTEAGHISQAAEIFLTRDDIAKLYHTFCEDA